MTKPHLAPGVRRCGVIALRLGGVSVFFVRQPFSLVANNETFQKASAHQCSSGWDCGHSLPASLPPPYFFNSSRYSISLLFECITGGANARSRARGRSSSRCQRAPLRAEYPHLPCVPKAQKKYHERAVTLWACVQMRRDVESAHESEARAR